MVGMLLLGFSAAPISQAKLPGLSPMAPVVFAYTGNVTIEPNGTIKGSKPGTIPIAMSGDAYTFHGQINGSLTILRSGAIVNGENFSIDPVYSSTLAAIALENATDVQIMDFNLSNGGPNFGVFLNNTSFDFLDHILVVNYYDGFEILNYTHNVNISNSGALYSFVSLATGLDPTGHSNVLATTSSNITIYNFTSNFSFGGILIDTKYSKVIDSSVSHFFAGGILSVANNTLFSGNRINVTNSGSGFSTDTSLSGITFHNVSFKNNVVWTNASSSTSTALISYQNMSGVISGNTIIANASGKQVSAIVLLNGADTVSNNKINITNAGQTSSLYSTGVSFSGGTYLVTDNQVNISGQNATGIGYANALVSTGVSTTGATVTGNILNLHVGGGYGILMNTTDSMISGNSVHMNTTYGSITAIGLNGFNDRIDGNNVAFNVYKVNPRSATGIGNASGLPGYFGNITIDANIISFEFPKVSLFDLNEFEGISFQSGSAKNISITANTITEPIYFGLAGPPVISVIINSGIQISDNLINGSGGIAALGNNSVVSFNNITFINPGIAFGGVNTVVSNALILDNTLNCLLDGSYSIDGDLQNNATIEGNYFYGNLINIGLGGGVSNTTIYHNDFFNLSAVPIETNSYILEPNSNISLNAPYPVGGNYYAGFSSTDIYSGPLQNIKGADGIFDTNYTSKYDPGNVDKYPLAKPWLRPQFTIHETGLINGAVWSATFNGETKTTESGSISFNIVNATYQTYSYSYSSVGGYIGSGSGTYSFTGGNGTTYTASYTPIYKVNFTESGLPAGSAWQISINGTEHNLTGSCFEIAVANGTDISYAVHNTTYYYTTAIPGQFAVSVNRTVNISFYHYSYLVGDLIPAGATLMVNGARVTVSNGHFNVTLAGGSYELVASDSGYLTAYKNVTLQPGQTYDINVSLNRANSSGFNTSLLEYAGIGAVAVILVGAVAFMMRRKK